MSDRPPTTDRGRIRIVGFDDADSGRPGDATSSGDGDESPAATAESPAERTARPTADTQSRTDPTAAASRPSGTALEGSGRSRSAGAWQRFRRNRTAMAGLTIIVVMAVLAVFARPIEVSTAEYTITLQPVSLAPYDPAQPFVGPANAPPSWAHPFGTDWAGRDQFSRVLVGGRYTLTVGLVAVSLALGVGIPLGAIAGYFGGRIDEIIMRLVDVLYAFPFLILAIGTVAILGRGFWKLVVALVVTGWIGYARLLRGEVLSVREREYVTAARALGIPDRTIIRRHVVPNAITPVVVQATLNVGTVVLTAAALGFLGLGLEADTAEWGAMLSRGRDSLLQGHWHVTVFPGIAIFLFVLAINLVGDGVNDALDPHRDASDDRRRMR
ncbi:ABC transporter permease [Natrinema gari]|uniref:Binding-protein-dependent transporters inner membrane component n=1 Tax=Natrinema gari JCM 14663 TaxID=1230459 RepID=L9YV82_9EURY|nr:ABC transporter permease [Natrinema gari]ELY77581.1 binding-protein-dependent transporters inner membrane component [Natrinema gari JCM 14663]